MNAYEIIESANYDLDHNKITLGEWEKRIEPTKNINSIVIEELEKIKAEIDVMYDSNNYTDEFEHGIMSVREIINKHISELRKESEEEE